MSNFSKIKWHFPASSNYTDYIENFETMSISQTKCTNIPGSIPGSQVYVDGKPFVDEYCHNPVPGSDKLPCNSTDPTRQGYVNRHGYCLKSCPKEYPIDDGNFCSKNEGCAKVGALEDNAGVLTSDYSTPCRDDRLRGKPQFTTAQFAGSSTQKDWYDPVKTNNENNERAKSCPIAIPSIQRGNNITAFNTSLTTVPAGAGGIYSFQTTINNSVENKWTIEFRDDLGFFHSGGYINGVKIESGQRIFDINSRMFAVEGANATKYNNNYGSYFFKNGNYYFDFSGQVTIGDNRGNSQVFTNLKARTYGGNVVIGSFIPETDRVMSYDDFIGEIKYTLSVTGNANVWLNGKKISDTITNTNKSGVTDKLLKSANTLIVNLVVKEGDPIPSFTFAGEMVSDQGGYGVKNNKFQSDTSWICYPPSCNYPYVYNGSKWVTESGSSGGYVAPVGPPPPPVAPPVVPNPTYNGSVPQFEYGKVYIVGDTVVFQGKPYIFTTYIGSNGYTPIEYPNNWSAFDPFGATSAITGMIDINTNTIPSVQNIPPSPMSNNSLITNNYTYMATASSGSTLPYLAFGNNVSESTQFRTTSNYSDKNYTGSIITNAGGNEIKGDWVQLQMSVPFKMNSLSWDNSQIGHPDWWPRDISVVWSVDGNLWFIAISTTVSDKNSKVTVNFPPIIPNYVRLIFKSSYSNNNIFCTVANLKFNGAPQNPYKINLYDSMMTYNIDDVIIYNDNLYGCKQNKSKGIRPDTTSNSWNKLSFDYNNSKIYKTSEQNYVTFQGKIYYFVKDIGTAGLSPIQAPNSWYPIIPDPSQVFIVVPVPDQLASSTSVILFDNINYTGKSVIVTDGEYSLSHDLFQKRFGNDSAKSIFIPTGKIVVLFSDDINSGPSTVLQKSVADLSQILDKKVPNGNWSDITSSIIIRPTNKLMFYREANFKGTGYPITSPGSFDYDSQFIRNQLGENSLTSLIVPVSMKVTLFSDGLNSGKTLVVNYPGISDLSLVTDTVDTGFKWDRNASSLIVTSTGIPEPIIFTPAPSPAPAPAPAPAFAPAPRPAPAPAPAFAPAPRPAPVPAPALAPAPRPAPASAPALAPAPATTSIYAYNNSKTYKANDIIIYQDNSYILPKFIGAAGYDPIRYPQYWSPYKPKFDNFKTYGTNDIVTFDNNFYIMTLTIGAAGYAPPAYPQHWSVYNPNALAPAPRPTPSPAPAPAFSPAPRPTPSPAPAPAFSPAPRPTPSPSPAPAFSPAPRPTPSPAPAPAFSPAPRPTPSPAPAPAFSPAPRPTPSPSPAPAFSPAPRPTPIGGPCMTDSSNWSNEKWIECTGKPKPGPTPSPAFTPSPSTLNPSTLPGLQLWLDSKDSSTLTLSGSNVSKWNDKSSNSNNFTVANTFNPPTSSSSGINFNSKQVMISSNPITTNSNTTIFFVGNVNNLADDFDYILSFSQEDLSFRWNPRSKFGDNSKGDFASDAGYIINTARGVNSSKIFDKRTLVNFKVENGGSGKLVLSTDRSFGGDRFFKGTMCEVLIYNSPLSATQIAEVQNYLISKWNLPKIMSTFDNIENFSDTSLFPTDYIFCISTAVLIIFLIYVFYIRNKLN